MRRGVAALALAATAALLSICVGAKDAHAYAELQQLYRSARAQAMGNAFVAIANDEDAIWYNPAGLAGVPRYTMNYATVDMDLAGDVVLQALSGGNAFGQFTPATINQMMGKDTYGRVQIAPSFVMPNFGFSILADGQAALYAKDQAFPDVTLGYQNTNGIQAAYGMSIIKRSKARTNYDIRVGAAAKILWRRGGYRQLPILSLTNIGPNTLGDIAGSWGVGYGGDIGVQYTQSFAKGFTANWGLAWTNIGDVAFASEADPVRNNLTMGFAGTYSTGKLDLTLAYDYAHMVNETDWRKRNHVGMEVKLPVMSIYGGLNQTYLTYGVSFDAWLFKITALSYGEELDEYLAQHGSRRYMLKIALKAGF